MAKRERFFQDKPITIQVNDIALEYLEDLGKTGLFGNTYQASAEMVFRHGLQQLIEAGKLKIKDRPLPKDGDD
jgi:hypothetical protein